MKNESVNTLGLWVSSTGLFISGNLQGSHYLVTSYHHFENGFDDKLDYYTLKEAEKAAQGYVSGTMEEDGFEYDGAAVYDQREHKCVRIYGDYPDAIFTAIRRKQCGCWSFRGVSASRFCPGSPMRRRRAEK